MYLHQLFLLMIHLYHCLSSSVFEVWNYYQCAATLNVPGKSLKASAYEETVHSHLCGYIFLRIFRSGLMPVT